MSPSPQGMSQSKELQEPFPCQKAIVFSAAHRLLCLGALCRQKIVSKGNEGEELARSEVL